MFQPNSYCNFFSSPPSWSEIWKPATFLWFFERVPTRHLHMWYVPLITHFVFLIIEIQYDTYYIQNSIKIPVLGILLLIFPLCLITSFNSKLVLCLYLPKTLLILLANLRLPGDSVFYIIIFIIVQNKLIPFWLHFLGISIFILFNPDLIFTARQNNQTHIK